MKDARTGGFPLRALPWALVGVLVACWLALVPLEGVAHIQDEVVYELQARLLSEGRLWEPARLPRAAHVFHFVWNEAPTAAFPQGRRFGIFPNGWPAVLAVGVAVGLPWLVAPLLHGLTVLVGAGLAGRVGGRRAASLAAPLLAFSPGLLLQAGSRLSHALCALLALAAVALVHGGLDRPEPVKPGRALAVGALLGLLLLTRPLDAVVVGGVLGAWVLGTSLWGARRHPLAWWPTVAAVAVAVALVLVQNHAYTGAWSRFPQDAWFALGEPPFRSDAFRYAPGCNALGFGPEHGCEPTMGSLGHTPAKAWQGIRHNATLAATLWLGGLPLPLVALGAARESRTRPLVLLAALLWAGLAAAYGLYWYAGTSLGARFHHAAAPLVIVAVALGAAAVTTRLRLPAAAGLLLLLPMVLRLSAALPELPGYWGVDGRMQAFEQSWQGGPALMLVAYGAPYRQDAPLPETLGDTVQYSALQRRALWIERRDGPLVYAELQPELVDATRAAWPDLPAYLLVLRADPADDSVQPLPAFDGVQQPDLPLPQDPVAWD